MADGTIYLYFKRKEDILIRLFQEKLGELVGKFHESVEGTTDAVEARGRDPFSELESNPELAYVTQIERQSDLERARKSARIEAIYCADREYSGTGHQRTEIPFRSERQAGAQPDFGAMDEAVTSWLISGRKYSLSDQADETLSFS